MQAVNHYIIIKQIKEKEKNVGGLILTEDVDGDNRYLKAKVISTGHKVEGITRDDIIYYDKHAGHGITWADTMYHVIRARDVVLVE